MKVSVSQYGSRRRYYIPELLERNNILGTLYTDSYNRSLLGRVGSLLTQLGLNLSKINRLSRRNPHIPTKKIKSSDIWQLKIAAALQSGDQIRVVESIFQGGAKSFIRKGIDGDWLYAMFIENIDFTEYAKSKGLKILVDIYENPFIFDELIKEYSLPDYQCIAYQKEMVKAQACERHLYLDRILKIADQYLIPSQYVADQLKKSESFDYSKVNIVPYPSSVKNKVYNNSPVKGRIIWIGNDPVRKGLAYASRAIKNLQKLYPEVELRAIGPMPKSIIESTDFSHVRFLGYLNKDLLAEEFNSADMFLFPTLSEGFAAVLLEAAAFGVPIITTHASGFEPTAPVKFIPTRDVDSIEKEVSGLLDNRNLRLQLSRDIFNYSQERTNTFDERVIEILTSK